MKKIYDVNNDKKIDAEDIEIIGKIDEINSKSDKRKLILVLIAGAGLVVFFILASIPFLPAEKINAISSLFDSILKYIPFTKGN